MYNVANDKNYLQISKQTNKVQLSLEKSWYLQASQFEPFLDTPHVETTNDLPPFSVGTHGSPYHTNLDVKIYDFENLPLGAFWLPVGKINNVVQSCGSYNCQNCQLSYIQVVVKRVEQSLVA